MAQSTPEEKNPFIRVEDLTFTFPDSTTGLENISLDVPAGSRTLLIGGMFYHFFSHHTAWGFGTSLRDSVILLLVPLFWCSETVRSKTRTIQAMEKAKLQRHPPPSPDSPRAQA